jgi:uncharacterized protein YchJ
VNDRELVVKGKKEIIDELENMLWMDNSNNVEVEEEEDEVCPCGSGKQYEECCGGEIDGEVSESDKDQDI